MAQIMTYYLITLIFLSFLIFRSICLKSKGTSSSSSSLYNYGNELLQFYRYIDIVNSIGRDGINISSSLYQKYDHSLDIFTLDNRTIFYDYRYELYNEEHSNPPYNDDSYPSIWHRQNISMEDGKAVKYKQDCQYHVLNDAYMIQYIEEEGNFYLNFIVQQHDCASGIADMSMTSSSSSLSHTDAIYGGSSYDILWQSYHYLAACTSIDHFNGSYSIYCPIRPSHNILYRIQGQECGNISVKLQYEHYDAYDNKGIQKFILMNEEIISATICPTILPHRIISEAQLRSYPIFLSSHNDTGNYDNTSSSLSYSQHLWSTTHTSLTSPIMSSNASYRYVWNAKHLSYVTRDLFHNCTDHKGLLLIGSSHMRYLYDFFYHSYIKPFDLLASHKSHRTHSNFAYDDILFARHIADAIANVSCDRKRIVIIQFGAWDLKFFPIANLILNINNTPKIIIALQNLMMRSECRDNVHILFLTAMPHPLCKDHDCGQGLNYWRNNAAIKALNQYLISSIVKLNHDLQLSSSIHILDIMPIILPHLLKWDDEVLYYNHFLFSGYQTTPQGIAMAMEVLHDVCQEEIAALVDSQDPISRSKIGFESAEVLFAIQREHDAIRRYYRWSYHTGCYRQFPDNIALAHYGYHEEQFHVLESNHILHQYIACQHASYASYKNESM